jgi:hypothetical protein
MPIFIPYDRLSITCDLNVEEAKRRISSEIGPRSSLLTLLLGGTPRNRYFGRITQQGALLVRGRPYMNTYRPLARIIVAARKDGSSVEGVVFAPGAVLLPLIFIPWMIVASLNKQWEMIAAVALVMACLHIVLWLCYVLEKRSLIESLKILFGVNPKNETAS